MRESMEKKLNIEEQEKELEQIREKLRKIIEKEKERKKKGEPYDPRLAIVDDEKLIEEDLKIYKKYRDGTWQEAEFQTYTDSVSKDLEKKADNSRDNFRDYLAEKAQLQFVKE